MIHPISKTGIAAAVAAVLCIPLAAQAAEIRADVLPGRG